MKQILIVGAGGLGREVEWLINRINSEKETYEIIGYIDDYKTVGTQISNLKVIGNVDSLSNISEDVAIVIAIANSKIRKELVQKIKKIKNFNFPNIVDPNAIINLDLIKGEGNIICAGTIATVDFEINNFNILDIYTTIGHDDIIKDYVTIYPNVNVSGNVVVNDCVEIGTGTQIIQGKTIGENVIIGAGTVVIKDVPANVTIVGVPSRIVKENN